MGTVSVGSLDQLNNLKFLQNAKSQKIAGRASLAVRFLRHEIENGLYKTKSTNKRGIYVYSYMCTMYSVHCTPWRLGS